MKISKIILYDDPSTPEIKIKEIERFLIDTFSVRVEIRGNFIDYFKNNIAEKIEKTIVFDTKKPFQKQKDKSHTNTNQEKGASLYDGFEVCKIVKEAIPKKENKLDVLHIIITELLTCTYDDDDFKYHARTSINSNPTIISTTGIVEGPAKPREYYLDSMTCFHHEELDEIKKKYKDQFVDYHDVRLSEIIRGLILQSILYYETGNAFCKQKDCRLFNAHWQKDLIFSQLENRKLCKLHSDILTKLKKTN